MGSDVLFTLLGNPHETDSVSTALSLCSRLLARGASVDVWACGNATLLTRLSLGATKPRNVFAGDVEHSTSAAWVQAALADHTPALTWSVCHFCSHERGALDHVDGVRTRPATAYRKVVAAAGKTITVGRL